jgi:phosphohistidine phosphatase SixA
MPVVILMRHADAVAFKPDHGTPDQRPLSSVGRVQADTVAWRIACSFGHANGGDALPDAKRGTSGRTGVRAATGRLEKVKSGELSEPSKSNTEELRSQASSDDDLDASFDPLSDDGIDLETLGLDPQPKKPAPAPDFGDMTSALPAVIRCSPALRCIQSAEPLVELLGSTAEPWDLLSEDREFDLLRDLMPELAKVPRAIIVTHQPQVESTLARLGVSHLGPVGVGNAFRLLLSGDGRLISARKV